MNAGFVKPAWHEVAVNLVFDDRGDCCSHGLEPFYAAEKIVRENDGSKRARCRVGGHSVSLKLYYQNSGIGSLNHPSSELETIREFRIAWDVVDKDDDVGERSGNIHIAPRTPNMADRMETRSRRRRISPASIVASSEVTSPSRRTENSFIERRQRSALTHGISPKRGFTKRTATFRMQLATSV